MSFSTADNVYRVHMLELSIMCTKITTLLDAILNDETKIDTELYTTYKAIYDQLKLDPSSETYFEGSFEEHLEQTLFDLKLEINQRRKN